MAEPPDKRNAAAGPGDEDEGPTIIEMEDPDAVQMKSSFEELSIAAAKALLREATLTEAEARQLFENAQVPSSSTSRPYSPLRKNRSEKCAGAADSHQYTLGDCCLVQGSWPHHTWWRLRVLEP